MHDIIITSTKEKNYYLKNDLKLKRFIEELSFLAIYLVNCVRTVRIAYSINLV